MSKPRGAFYMHMSFGIPEENLDEFKASAAILKAETDKEEGSINFFWSADAKEPNVFLLYEEWKDDAALAAHKEAPYFKAEFEEKIAKYWQFKVFAKGIPLWKTVLVFFFNMHRL